MVNGESLRRARLDRGRSEWGRIYPDQAMRLAAIDRLVHHATILEMNVESYRRREALDRKRGRGRPPAQATITKSEV
jgi:IstB-like ATP binding protein